LVVAVTLVVVLCLPLIGIYFVQDMAPSMGYTRASYPAGIGVLGATFVVGWGLLRFLLRPVQTMRDRVGALRSGDDAALDPLDQYGTSDMQALGQSFLDMGRALRNREAVLRGYADHVTHELKSPLTVVRGAAELLASPDLPPAERDRLTAKVEAAAARMTALLDAQRDLARAQEPSARGVARLSDVATDIEVLQDGNVPLPADALRLVLDHLNGNAKAHGATRISAALQGRTLTFQDDGKGISQGNRDRIFEPFFTTRRETGGTGMGLSIVRRILEAHEADIALVPSETGTRFDITF
jgi:signal transduction histidine kinase